MKIPYTIPELVLRVYTRKLTPEKLEEERKGRRYVAEDPDWDNEKPCTSCTLVKSCLKTIVKNFEDFTALVDQTNQVHQQNFDYGFEEWQKVMEEYQREYAEYKEKEEAYHDKLANLDDLDKIDDDIDDSFWEDIPVEPTPPPDAPPALEGVKSVLDQLNIEDRVAVVQDLDPEEVSLDLALRTIPDEYYWKQLAEERYPEAHLGEHGNSWKRLFVEKSLREFIEFFHPRTGDFELLEKEVERYSPYVKELWLYNLIPACYGYPQKSIVPDVFEADEELVGDEDEGYEQSEYMLKKQEEAEAKDEGENIEEAEDYKDDKSHIDFNLFLPKLKNLKTLKMIINMVEMGIDFEPRLVEFTSEDCKNLATALAQCRRLHNFDLQKSRITGEHMKVLVRDGLFHMRHLRSINLSYNKLGNSGAKALARLICDKDACAPFTVHTLILTSCRIRRKGAKALAYAISMNNHIKQVVLRLNPIHDSGGKAIANALVEHESMLILDLSATHIGDSTCKLIGKMMLHNDMIRQVNLSSNMGITKNGAVIIAKAVSTKDHIYSVDLRLTNSDKVVEFNILHHARKNVENSVYVFLNKALRFSKKEGDIPNRKRMLRLLREAEEAEEEGEGKSEEDEYYEFDEETQEYENAEEGEEEEIKVIMKPRGKVSKELAKGKGRGPTMTRQEMTLRRIMRAYEKTKDEELLHDPYLNGKVLDNYIAELQEKTKIKEKPKRKRRRVTHWDHY